MATNEEKLVSAFQEKVSIRSFFNLANMFIINFWEQTISKWRLVAILNFNNFVIFNYLKKMQNSWTMNMKQNVMSHTRITYDKFRSYIIQNGCQSAIQNFFSYYLGNLA